MSIATDTTETAFRREYPFDSHFLNFDGWRYHYLDEGAGRPLLFVHGNPTWSFAWRNLIKGLSDEHHCLAVDHIGCGFSDKPQGYKYRLARHTENLERFITELDLRDITLIAHDWGGAIGLGAAVSQPERFSRIILMNTAAFRSRAIPWRIAACRIPLLGTFAVRGLGGFSRSASWMAVEKRLAPAVRAGYLRPYDNWAHRVAVWRFVKDIPLRPEHPSYPTLAALENHLPQLAEKPMLLAWGMKDWCFTPAFLAQFEHIFPQAQVHRFNHAGHYLFEDEPMELLETLRDFLHRQSSPAADALGR